MTRDEMREEFLKALAWRVRYWLYEERAVTPQQKLEGLAFGFLTILDGCCLDLPAFSLIPRTDEDGWAKEDIGGALHEQWHRVMRAVNREGTEAQT